MVSDIPAVETPPILQGTFDADFPWEYAWKQWIKDCPGSWEEGTKNHRCISYLDSYDCMLLGRGVALIEENTAIRAVSKDGSSPKPKKKDWETDIRPWRLLPQWSIHIEQQSYRFRDHNNKLWGLVLWETGTRPALKVFSEKGYERFLLAVLEQPLKQWSMKKEAPEFRWGIDTKNARNSSFVCFPTDPRIRLWSDMMNESFLYYHGLIENRDRECLHALRVSIRKALVYAALMKAAGNPFLPEAVRVGCKQILKSTNRIRDYDIFLERADIILERLPEECRTGWRSICHIATCQRDAAHDAAIEQVSSLFKDVLSCIGSIQMPASEFPFRSKNIDRYLLKKARKILSFKKADFTRLEEERIHECRVQVKMLRYAYEAFHADKAVSGKKKLVNIMSQWQNKTGVLHDSFIIKNMLTGIEQDPVFEQNPDNLKALGCAATIVRLDVESCRADLPNLYERMAKKIGTAFHVRASHD